MPRKLPFFNFFPGDWVKDTRMLKLNTRAIWMDLLCLMHDGDRRGYLSRNDTPLTHEQIAAFCGCSSAEVSLATQELIHSGVASCTDHGVIYSRRMVREERKRSLCSEAGKRGGGNPALKGQSKGGSKGQSKGTLGMGMELDSSVISGKKKKGVQGEKEKGFPDFWEAYPKKVAKKLALKAWIALQPSAELQSIILVAVEAQKKSVAWIKDGGQFIPHPASWLNARRWEDEVTVTTTTPPESPPKSKLQAQAEDIWDQFLQGGSDANP